MARRPEQDRPPQSADTPPKSARVKAANTWYIVLAILVVLLIIGMVWFSYEPGPG